ncbi:Nucleotide-binding universal stress protein, UspA family [Halopelagius inordinatus]|uniref:Nucleotide-binding universal stress protein, UspA family n=1 Tax=Halopelagius inordinatus TaxID=553467 RepID=A0A1I2UWD1_9EURY|nr:universal stress protein [Halopelagius inordinatus]SFG80489.1 Nucleotide-binding universal stress protein, UspA family [Halopelagius inordinatus]
MTFVVPFDGSELAEAALVRAVEFASVFEEDVVAVAVIPNRNRDYAREHGWLGPDEAFEMSSVVSKLHRRVVELCPSADFRHEVVDRFAPAGTIARELRRTAEEEGASMVFVGSENAGRIVSPVSSVGRNVAADDSYDVVVVRHRRPTKVKKLRESSPHRHSKSDFYLPD